MFHAHFILVDTWRKKQIEKREMQTSRVIIRRNIFFFHKLKKLNIHVNFELSNNFSIKQEIIETTSTIVSTNI